MIALAVIVILCVLLGASTALLIDARRDRRQLLKDVGAERDRADILDALAAGYLTALSADIQPEDHGPCGRNLYRMSSAQHELDIRCTLPAGHDTDCAALSGHPC